MVAFRPGTVSEDSFYFPMGEYHCRFPSQAPIRIDYHFPGDLTQLVIAREACGKDKPYLYIPYFPFARQDRVTGPREPHSLRAFARVINHLDFKGVLVVDPHSDVVEALVDRIHIVPQHHYAQEAVKRFEPTCIAVPDAGAMKKAGYLSQATGIPLLCCGKSRDTKTGKLSGFWAHHEGQDLARVLVVDDICDGGGTFIGLAQELKKLGAGSLGLYVTHGGFTKGTKPLKTVFDFICCTDSITPTPETVRDLQLIPIWDENNV